MTTPTLRPRLYVQPLLLLLVLLVLLPAATATTYYISSSRGSDSNAGTSPDTPFKSLNKSFNLPFAPGDAVLLARGDTWIDETMELVFMDGVSVGAYGDAALARPTIQHSRSAVLKTTCITLTNAHNTRVTSLHIAGCSTGILIQQTVANLTNLEIADCFFADINQPFQDYQPSGGDWGEAITLIGQRFSNFSIHHCVGVRLDTFASVGGQVHGAVLDSNTVSQCGYNCIGLSGSDMLLTNSVFLRDRGDRLFQYGVTDIIVGTVSGPNTISNSCFVLRGEYPGGPDGCSVDFETSATDGFRVEGCTFYRSWGAGIMVFGHDTTSQQLHITDNLFLESGCTQPRDDRGGIAVMCPANHKPSGVIANNTFTTCPNSEAIHQRVPGCDSNFSITGNTINTAKVVDKPQISFEPEPPTSNATTVNVTVIAFCTTPNVTFRYTMDGSRPTEASPVLDPTVGVPVTYPGPDFAFNVRAFKDGYLPSATDGSIIERRLYRPRTEAAGARSSFDGINFNSTTGQVSVMGWAVDVALSGGGVPPVSVAISVDGQAVATVVAKLPRPDLVKAGVAPNPDHGFDVALPANIAHMLMSKRHVVGARIVGSPSCPGNGCLIGDGPSCTINGAPGPC